MLRERESRRNGVAFHALIPVILLSIAACSDSNRLTGETFVNIDRSESLIFRDNDRVEIMEDMGTFEGDYSIEDDGRVRLAVNVFGNRMITYGTTNEDGGLTVEFGGHSPTRFFLANDPKLPFAMKARKILLETRSKICSDGLCMPLLVPKTLRPLVITDVDVTGIGRNKIPFAEIEKVELFEPRDSRDMSVKIKAKGDAFFGGWRELRFPERATRDEFYRILVIAVRDWHDSYGVTAFIAEDLPESMSAVEQSSEERAPPPSRSTPADPLFANWRSIEEKVKFSFAPDGTFAVNLDEPNPIFGTYQRIGSEKLEIAIFDDSSDKTKTVQFQYMLDGNDLVLRDVKQSKTLTLVRLSGTVPQTLKPAQAIEPMVLSIEEQILEGRAKAAGVKLGVAETFQDLGRFPANNAEAGISEANTTNRYVTSIAVTPPNGVVKITFGGEADTKLTDNSIYLVPSARNNRIDWECYSDRSISSYAPASCQKILPVSSAQAESTQQRSRKRDRSGT